MTCFFIVTVGWIFSVCLHEFGHAWAADRGGDYTVRAKGYLTFNPLKYTHPIYSIGLPILFLLLGGIGLPGGAVYVNVGLLRSRGWRSAVSLAGPAMNGALIVVLGLAFRLGLVPRDAQEVLSVSLAFLLHLQVSALLLNLIPVPPLDGFQAISPWLPEEMARRAMEWANAGTFLLFILLWYVEPVNGAFWKAVFAISELAGVPPELGWAGWQEYRFWRRSQ
jgi:Zn-dependent protease